MSVAFDHLVFGAASLEQGDAWASGTFSAPFGPGGAHPLMGTHNRLSRLASGYLELIAIDPAAPPPERPRWYGLDAPHVRAAIAERPRPIAWALSATDLEDAARRADWDVGAIVAVSRGDLHWRMALPEDGLPVEGVLPALIEWPESLLREPPLYRMTPAPRALRRLTLLHAAPESIRSRLQSVGAEEAMRAAGVELAVRAPGVEDGPDGAARWPLEAMFTPPTLNVSA